MRILHVVGKLDRGGAETWLVQVLRNIDRQKYQIDFLVHTTDTGAYDEEVRSLGSRIIPCLSPTSPAEYTFNFFRILRECGPYDVVHSHVHHFSGFVMLLSALMQVPVRVAHGHTAKAIHQPSTTLKHRFYDKFMHDLIARFSTQGVAVSRDAADGLFPMDWQRDLRWRIAYTGIDLLPFEQPVDRAEVRSELGIPSDAVVIGHVGRFVPEKNHSFLLRVAREFTSLEPRAFFLLVGDGELRVGIESQVEALGLKTRFKFARIRPDVPRLMMGAMDVLLLPSLYEGVPITLLEAQAANLPCLVSDVITSECDLVLGLIARENLCSPARLWAEGLQRASYRALKRRGAVPLKVRERSICHSTVSLMLAYGAAEEFSRPFQT
jgi:glycosyltransferase involved in cell wall biosynthesis